MLTKNHRWYKTSADGIIGTFPFVYSLVARTHVILKSFETIYTTKHMFILQIIRI